MSSRRTGAAQGLVGLNSKRILVIEDNRSLQTALVRLLKVIRPDYEVDWATTADEVFEALQDQKVPFHLVYELVIADITLPGKLSGFDFWAHCSRSYPSVAFLIMSAMGTEQYLALTSRTHTPPPFLSKPFSLSDCREAIEPLVARPPFRVAA